MRELTVDVVKAILALPDDDDRFWTAPEIVRRYLGNGSVGTAHYIRVRKAVYHLGWRNGLTENPDNGERDDQGRVKRGLNGKALLFDGKDPAFKSSRWKSLVSDWVESFESEEQEKKARPRQWKNPALLTVAVLLPFLVLGFTLNLSQEAWTVYKKLGSQKALAYLGADVEKSVELYFDAGWYHYQDMNYLQALEIAENILRKKRTPENFKAKALYLLCAIEIDRGNFVQAEVHYEQAEDLYLRLNNQVGLARLSLEKARILRRQEDFAGALIHIEDAEQVLGSSRDVSLQLAKVYYGLGEYSLSMEKAFHLTKCGIKPKEADAFIHLGHCSLVLGDLKGALYYLWKADALIQDIGNENLQYYGMVQRVYLAKCLGIEIEEYRQRIIEWAQKNEESLILKQLSDIEEMPCRLKYGPEDDQ